MKLNDLRPHIQSRLAHELGKIFLDRLPIDCLNKMAEKDAFVGSVMYSSEMAKQISPKLEPDMLMDSLYQAAVESGLLSTIKDTNPKGHSYVELVSASCHMVLLRRESSNTCNAQYYTKKALTNAGLLTQTQGDMLAITQTQDDEPLENLLFVCAEVGWQSNEAILDITFILPHPTKNYPLLKFTLHELQMAADQPLTDIAEEPLPSIRKRLDEADDESTGSS